MKDFEHCPLILKMLVAVLNPKFLNGYLSLILESQA